MSNHWYALHCKPHMEAFVAGQLDSRQIEFYYPTLRVQPVNPRSQKVKPYFPGYLFIHADLNETGNSILNWIPGARGLVCFGGQPVSMPDHLIAVTRLRVERTICQGGGFFAGLKAGDRVNVRDGPLAGYQAMFDLRIPGSQRVRVLLKILGGQYTRVELPYGFIEPVRQF